MKFNKIKSRRGETLIEVLIAIIVLVIGSLGAVRLLGIANIHNQLTKERVIATNLSREGLEAVRNIRDTNWLRFAGERRRCWNNADFTDFTCDGSVAEMIGHEHYYKVLFEDTNYRWTLDEAGLNDRLDLAGGYDLAIDEDYRLWIKDGIYNHDNTGDESVYFREIYTEYLDPDQTLATDETANILRVTSKVEWVDRGKISEVVLTTILTDYLGRKNHN